MKPSALALLFLLLSGQQQLGSPANNTKAQQQTGKAGGGVTLSGDKKPPHGETTTAGQQQHGTGAVAQPSVSQQCFLESAWQRFKSLHSADQISLGLLLVTTLYLAFTIMIWREMIKANKHAETAYEGSKKDTAETLRIAGEGQVDTRRAVKVAADQLAAIMNAARARLTISGITKLQAMLLRGKYSIKVEIVNRGHTPAIEVDSGGRSVVIGKHQRIDWDALPQLTKQLAHIPLIGAGMSAQITIELPEVDAAMEEAIFSGEQELRIHGTLDYDDVFRGERESLERCFLQYHAVWDPVYESWDVRQQDY